MKPIVLFAVACSLQAATLHFEITDGKGKKPGGVSIEAAEPDADGWYNLTAQTKGKGSPVLIWPFDRLARVADGPGDIPVIIAEPGDSKALANPNLMAHVLAGELLGVTAAVSVDRSPAALSKLETSGDPFVKGVALLYGKKPEEAADFLSRALKERERQLTRVPSEIYPAAILCGKALLDSKKFDDAAVAFLKALKQRPSDPVAAKLRAEALTKAGKPEAQ